MIKIFISVVFSLFFLVNLNANERELQLNNLFNQLKKNNSSITNNIEMKIWKVWSTHPSKKNLTNLLAEGSFLMSKRKYNEAYNIFSRVIFLDPSWSEAWNKRATVLYIMKRYKESQQDIDEVLKLEKRHFGALAGQGLVSIALQDYEKAINSYKEVQKIHPNMESPKIMIQQIKELIKSKSI
jgi:tetratricopeptide (TPR) repeat protein